MTDCNVSVKLRALDSDLAVCFVSGTENVEVPGRVAARSELLADLQSETQKETIIELPLTMIDVLAWVACARIEDVASQADDVDDNTAARALKVSSRDPDTERAY